MLTFSVNNELTKEQRIKIFNLMEQMNDYNRELLGEAYINIVCGKKRAGEHIVLNRYAEERIVYQKLEDERNGEVSLEEQFEEIDWEIAPSSFVVDGFEDDVIRKADSEDLLKEFLALRKKKFLKRGIDIWRLIELIYKENDAEAIAVLPKYCDKPEEKTLLASIFRMPDIIEKLDNMLS